MGRSIPAATFDCVFPLEDIGASRLAVAFSATADECQAIAAWLGCTAIRSLSGTAKLRAIGGKGAVELQVCYRAEVCQTCVLSLEPVDNVISNHFRLVYAPEETIDGEVEVEIDVAAEDPPEPLPAHAIDIGAAVVEQLALSIDPYPRKTGVESYSDQLTEATEEMSRPNPFAVLRDRVQKS